MEGPAKSAQEDGTGRDLLDHCIYHAVRHRPRSGCELVQPSA